MKAIRFHWLVAASSFVIGGSALAAPPAPSRARVDSASEEASLIAEMTKARAAVQASEQATTTARTALQALEVERKAGTQRLTQLQRDLRSHASSGKLARAAHERGVAAGKAADATTAAALTKARDEYALARSAGEAAIRESQALLKGQESSGKQLGDLLKAAAAAKLEADGARASRERLRALVTAGNAEASKSASSAATAASSAQLASGISPTGYAARRTKAEAEVQKVGQELTALEQALAGLKGASTPKPAKAPLKQCDLRKVVWSTVFPSSSSTTEDGTEEDGIVNVDYLDLDGDGSVEALVTTMRSHLGLTAHQHWTLHVMTRDRDCVVSEAGTLDGPLCASATYAGTVVTFEDGCEGSVAEYRLIKGQLKETKRRP